MNDNEDQGEFKKKGRTLKVTNLSEKTTND